MQVTISFLFSYSSDVIVGFGGQAVLAATNAEEKSNNSFIVEVIDMNKEKLWISIYVQSNKNIRNYY